MSVVSKTWKSVLNSVPDSHFDVDTEIPSVLYCLMDPYGCKRKKAKGLRNHLTTWVDKSMRVCHEHANHKKCIIECFRLRAILSRFHRYKRAAQQTVHGNKEQEQEQEQVFDDRIELIAKNYVKKLDLNYKIYSLSWYHFPPTTLDGALVVLNLCNCGLEIPASKRLSCFQVLRLSNVDLNGLAGHLLSICPSLETLDIKSCRNIKHLQISSNFKLKNVLGFQTEAYTYYIDATTLQTLHLYEIPQFLEMSILNGAVSCSNLKELSLCSTYHTFITSKIIETLISKFPYLEELTFSASFDSAKILKVSSHLLRKLSITLHGNNCVKEVNINTPNPLVYLYSCTANNIPSTISLNSTQLRVANLELNFSCGMLLGRSWFLKLGEYLGNFTPVEELNLGVKPHSEMGFLPGDIREAQTVPSSSLAKITHLRVVDNPSVMVDFIALVEGLLLCCHPLTLSVTASYPPNINYMVKVIYKHLMSKEDQNADYLSDNHNDCLQQHLKSVTIKRLIGTKNGRKFYAEDLTVLPTDLEEVKVATFELNWLLEN
ncbi:hypothetical protein FF1_046427 [Malus domestica]